MTRRRTLIILCISTVAFVGMVVIVSTGVLNRRRNRDLMFGLEQLDVLIADGRLAEAGAMIPWLADRADEVNEVFSVLKRGVAVLDAGAGPEPLDAAAMTGVNKFPGNTSIRAIGAYAAVLAGDGGRALEWGREHLADPEPDIYAWIILKSGVGPETESLLDDLTAPNDALFLANLTAHAGPDDFERAWRSTGDWRYAVDAAGLLMREGAVARATEIAVGASLVLRQPLMAADLFSDGGDHDGALRALLNAPDETAAVSIRAADAMMGLGRFGEARVIYDRLVRSSPELSEVPYVNLGWLAQTGNDAISHYDAAVLHFPSSWRAIEQRALYLAQTDRSLAFGSLRDYTGQSVAAREEFLRLRLQPSLVQRGYEALVWRLVNAPDADEDGLRYAAWYFAGRGQFDAVTQLMDRVEGESSWANTYRGISYASARRWGDSVPMFERAFLSAPSWETSLNLALALFAAGRIPAGMTAIDEAEKLARRSDLPANSAVLFTTIARVHDDRIRTHQAVKTALQIDPTNTTALLLRSQLESAPAY